MKRVALIAALAVAALVIAVGVIWFRSGVGAVHDHLDSAKVDKARMDVLQIETAAKQYRLRNGGEWPATLDALAEKTAGKSLIEKEALLDPWNRPYQFRLDGTGGAPEQFIVWSQGPDPSDAKGAIYGAGRNP
jgi:hypothetical protein